MWVNTCLLIDICPVIDWWPVQGLHCLLHKLSRSRLLDTWQTINKWNHYYYFLDRSIFMNCHDKINYLSPSLYSTLISIIDEYLTVYWGSTVYEWLEYLPIYWDVLHCSEVWDSNLSSDLCLFSQILIGFSSLVTASYYHLPKTCMFCFCDCPGCTPL